MHKGLVVAAVAAVLAACSSTPERNEELDQARAVVQRVEAMPDAGKYAANDVMAANDALRKADQLLKDDKSDKAVTEAAYLARRHAETAEQHIVRGQAEAATAKAEEERQRVLLQAREQEAAARQREAAARELEAQMARSRAEQEAARAAEDVARANQQVELARREAELMAQQLRDLQAKETERGLVLTLGDVLFDSGKATLKPGAHGTISRLAQFLQQSRDRSVTIEGHTDSVGADAYNQTLSENRASAVRDALVAQGVDASRIFAVGKGESTPVASNDDAAGRQQNRRVEIIISNASRVSANE